MRPLRIKRQHRKRDGGPSDNCICQYSGGIRFGQIGDGARRPVELSLLATGREPLATGFGCFDCLGDVLNAMGRRDEPGLKLAGGHVDALGQ